MMFRLLIVLAILALAGCGGAPTEGEIFREVLASSPLTLSSEQVTLNQGQVDCGVRDELWDPPNGVTAKLTQKGRDLNFTDDVRVSDPNINVPYSQVTGKFPISVGEITKVRDAGGGMKLADVKVGIVISHACFPAPLPIMGIRKGQFAPDAPVVFRFRGGGTEWALDKLMH